MSSKSSPEFYSFQLSEHALKRLNQRQDISLEWIERILTNPTYIQQDPKDYQLKQAFGRIPEYGDRLLKIVYNDQRTPWIVVTVYFDRTMGKKLL